MTYRYAEDMDNDIEREERLLCNLKKECERFDVPPRRLDEAIHRQTDVVCRLKVTRGTLRPSPPLLRRDSAW